MFFSVSFFLACLVIGYLGLIYVMRTLRRFKDTREEPVESLNFTVADLHRMVAAGQMTPQEFERAREVVLRQQSQPAPVSKVQPTGRGFEVITKPKE
jgi:hypothetical protein